jgi:hypothetical protein
MKKNLHSSRASQLIRFLARHMRRFFIRNSLMTSTMNVAGLRAANRSRGLINSQLVPRVVREMISTHKLAASTLMRNYVTQKAAKPGQAGLHVN